MQEIDASRAPQVLKIDHDDSIPVSSSDIEDDDVSDDEIAACSEIFDYPEPLPQSYLLPDIESGLHLSVKLCPCSVSPFSNSEQEMHALIISKQQHGLYQELI